MSHSVAAPGKSHARLIPLRVQAVPLMVGAGLLSLLLPSLVVDVPPVADYANHLARMWLIAGGAEQAPLSAFYAVEWSRTWTNIAVDLAAATAGRLVGVERLGPVLLALSFVLPPLGAVLLNRHLFGGWHWWQVLFAGFGWCATALLGFMNFQMGLGVALIGAALDGALERRGRWTAIAGRMAIGAVLVVFHPFDVLFYAALLGGLALGRHGVSRSPDRELRRVLRAVGTAAPAVIPVVVSLVLTPSPPGSEVDTLDPVLWHPLSMRLVILMETFISYGPLFDYPLLIATAGALVVALRLKRLEVHFGLVVTGLFLGGLAFLMPYKLTDTYYIDHRLPIMAVLTLLAAVRPAFHLKSAWAKPVTAALLGVVLAKSLMVGNVWWARQADVRSLQRAISDLPHGSMVLPVIHQVPGRRGLAPRGRLLSVPAYWHLPTLAIMERQVFVPTLFAAAGKQPVVIRPQWADIASPNSPVVTVSALKLRPEQIPDSFAMLRPWRERFEYVLVLGADLPDRNNGRTVPELTLVRDEGFAQLYAVQPGR